ncbi:group 1 truncated hemoglobin [Luedemannella helvata]|uniref:Group 1 truncated hemoglobin n=1 Tax=Luedemannella helvata TaxID=349315 RepID=A0ABP4WYA4_9ACTN
MTQTAEPTFYEQVGGGPAVQKLVEVFYDLVWSDPQLAGYFVNADRDRLRVHQAKLISSVLGGPREYSGRELAEAHQGLNITSADYDRVVEHLVAACAKLDVPQHIVSAVGSVVAEVKPAIATGEAGRP